MDDADSSVASGRVQTWLEEHVSPAEDSTAMDCSTSSQPEFFLPATPSPSSNAVVALRTRRGKHLQVHRGQNSSGSMVPKLLSDFLPGHEQPEGQEPALAAFPCDALFIATTTKDRNVTLTPVSEYSPVDPYSLTHTCKVHTEQQWTPRPEGLVNAKFKSLVLKVEIVYVQCLAANHLNVFTASTARMQKSLQDQVKSLQIASQRQAEAAWAAPSPRVALSGNLAVCVTDSTQELLTQHQREIGLLRGHIQELQHQLEVQTRANSELDDKVQRLQSELNETLDQEEGWRQQAEELRQQVAHLTPRHDSSGTEWDEECESERDQRITGLQEQVQQLKTELAQALAQHKQQQEDVQQQLELQLAAMDWEPQLQALRKENSELKEAFKRACSELDHLNAQSLDFQEQERLGRQALDLAQQQVAATQQEVDRLQQALDVTRKLSVEHLASIRSGLEREVQLQVQVKRLSEKVAAQDRLISALRDQAAGLDGDRVGDHLASGVHESVCRQSVGTLAMNSFRTRFAQFRSPSPPVPDTTPVSGAPPSTTPTAVALSRTTTADDSLPAAAAAATPGAMHCTTVSPRAATALDGSTPLSLAPLAGDTLTDRVDRGSRSSLGGTQEQPLSHQAVLASSVGSGSSLGLAFPPSQGQHDLLQAPAGSTARLREEPSSHDVQIGDSDQSCDSLAGSQGSQSGSASAAVPADAASVGGRTAVSGQDSDQAACASPVNAGDHSSGGGGNGMHSRVASMGAAGAGGTPAAKLVPRLLHMPVLGTPMSQLPGGAMTHRALSSRVTGSASCRHRSARLGFEEGDMDQDPDELVTSRTRVPPPTMLLTPLAMLREHESLGAGLRHSSSPRDSRETDSLGPRMSGMSRQRAVYSDSPESAAENVEQGAQEEQDNRDDAEDSAGPVQLQMLAPMAVVGEGENDAVLELQGVAVDGAGSAGGQGGEAEQRKAGKGCISKSESAEEVGDTAAVSDKGHRRRLTSHAVLCGSQSEPCSD